MATNLNNPSGNKPDNPHLADATYEDFKTMTDAKIPEPQATATLKVISSNFARIMDHIRGIFAAHEQRMNDRFAFVDKMQTMICWAIGLALVIGMGFAGLISGFMYYQATKIDANTATIYEMRAEAQERDAALNARLDETNARLDETNARLDGLDARLDGLDAKFDGLDAKFDVLLDEVRRQRE